MSDFTYCFDKNSEKNLVPPCTAAFSSASCKISSGIWLATRRTTFDDEAFGVEVPMNLRLGLTGLTGTSIPSVVDIADAEVGVEVAARRLN